MSLLNEFLKTKEGKSLNKVYPNIPLREIYGRRSFILDDDKKITDCDFSEIESKKEKFRDSYNKEEYDFMLSLDDEMPDQYVVSANTPNYEDTMFFENSDGDKAQSDVFLNEDEFFEKNYWDSLGQKFFIPFKCISYEFVKPIMVGGINGVDHGIAGVIIYEPEPFKFKVISIGLPMDGKYKVKVAGNQFSDVWEMMAGVPHLDVFHNRLISKKTYIGNSGLKIKTNFEGDKLINKTVYMTHKNYISSMESKIKTTVNWTHKWEVRGHWRKVNGIGHDREGNKNVNGFAWVKDHAKGIGDLVIKKRASFVENKYKEGTQNGLN